MGSALACMGRAQEAEAHVLEALRLSPRDAMIFEWFLVAGSAKTLLGEFAEASAWLRKSIDANRNRPLAFFLLAACLAHLGRLDEARREVRAGLAVDPDFTLRRFRAGAQSDDAVYLAQRARVIEGIRLAGVPEDDPLPRTLSRKNRDIGADPSQVRVTSTPAVRSASTGLTNDRCGLSESLYHLNVTMPFYPFGADHRDRKRPTAAANMRRQSRSQRRRRSRPG